MVCQNRKWTRIILIVTGIVLIAVGILVGILLVRGIKTKVDQNNCVTSKDDTTYKAWVGPSTLRASVYFWHIKNKDGFLHKRENPQLEERGPYVYKTTSQKIDVNFDSKGRVSYKTFTKQAFDAEATKEQCPNCSDNDNITVLNLGYLGLMSKFKGDTQFSMFMIPHLVTNYMKQLEFKLGNRQNALAFIGNVSASNSSLNPHPVFGQWLATSKYRAAIVDSRRSGKSYNVSEMQGLYNVLMNGTLLLPPPMFNATTANYSSRGNGLLSYLGYYINIKKLATNHSDMLSEQARKRMEELLCTDHETSCFSVNDTKTVLALYEFISNHIPSCVMAFLDSINYGIIVTRSQKELALGYLIKELKLPPNFPNGVPVPGALTNHFNESDSLTKGKKESLYTCSNSKKELANTWAEYDGKTEVPSHYYPNAPSSQNKIPGGYHSQFPTAPKLSPCTDTYPAIHNQYDMFFAPLYLRLKITYEKPVTHHGIVMHRYLVDAQNFQQNNYSVFTDGIMDLHNLRGFPLASSLAGFLYGDKKLYEQLGMEKPTRGYYSSFVDIEPITGRPMVVKYRIQMNSVITKDVISVPRLHPYNMTFYDADGKKPTKYFPIYWVEQGGALSAADAERLNNQMFMTFRIACSVTIVLPIIGGLLLLSGIVLTVLVLMKKSQESTNVSTIEVENN